MEWPSEISAIDGPGNELICVNGSRHVHLGVAGSKFLFSSNHLTVSAIWTTILNFDFYYPGRSIRWLRSASLWREAQESDAESFQKDTVGLCSAPLTAITDSPEASGIDSPSVSRAAGGRERPAAKPARHRALPRPLATFLYM